MNPAHRHGDDTPDEFYYRLPWQVESAFPGFHASRHSGAGERFRGLSPLLRHPDPRRIDLRASLRDPFGNLQVRIMQQRSRSNVFVIADLSASMASGNKLALLRQIAVACAWSASRTGDSFGFAACAETVRDELLLTRSSGLHVAAELRRRLDRLAAGGTHAESLRLVAGLLPRQRTLVFLISDFFLPQPLLDATLASLARHMIVPIVIERSAEANLPDRFGLCLVRDRESGSRRLLLLTRSLRRRARDGYQRWRDSVEATCLRHGAAPFHVRDCFIATRLTDYFLQRA